jgi:hypothetical protein
MAAIVAVGRASPITLKLLVGQVDDLQLGDAGFGIEWQLEGAVFFQAAVGHFDNQQYIP